MPPSLRHLEPELSSPALYYDNNLVLESAQLRFGVGDVIWLREVRHAGTAVTTVFPLHDVRGYTHILIHNFSISL